MDRSLLQDILNIWLNDFVSFAAKRDSIDETNLMLVADKEKAHHLYEKWVGKDEQNIN